MTLIIGLRYHIAYSLEGLDKGARYLFYLFLLCAEAFSTLIYEVERRGSIMRLQCTLSCPSHLSFANDSIVFTRTNTSDCLKIRRILEVCEKISNQKINRRIVQSCLALMWGKGGGIRFYKYLGYRVLSHTISI